MPFGGAVRFLLWVWIYHLWFQETILSLTIRASFLTLCFMWTENLINGKFGHAYLMRFPLYLWSMVNPWICFQTLMILWTALLICAQLLRVMLPHENIDPNPINVLHHLFTERICGMKEEWRKAEGLWEKIKALSILWACEKKLLTVKLKMLQQNILQSSVSSNLLKTLIASNTDCERFSAFLWTKLRTFDRRFTPPLLYLVYLVLRWILCIFLRRRSYLTHDTVFQSSGHNTYQIVMRGSG